MALLFKLAALALVVYLVWRYVWVGSPAAREVDRELDRLSGARRQMAGWLKDPLPGWSS